MSEKQQQQQSSLSSSLPPPGMTLTPEARNAEATAEATNEGIVNGLLTLIPLMGLVSIALQKSPSFVKHTNWQSRTAMVLMPSLFVMALTSEQKLAHKMKEISMETQHSSNTVQWAEEQLKKKQQQQQQQLAHIQDIKRNKLLFKQEKKQNDDDSNETDNNNNNNNNNEEHNKPSSSSETLTTASTSKADHEYLRALYLQSIEQSSGICVVDGDTLKWYHHFANYTAANPIKVLGSFAIPSIAWIFYGRTEKQHLDFSVKLLHTRVFGQFATISLLLSVMGFKEFMDRNGRFISQSDAEQRILEMHMVRQDLLQRLQYHKEQDEQMKRTIALAHEEDILLAKEKRNKEFHGSNDTEENTSLKKKKKKRKKKVVIEEQEEDKDQQQQQQLNDASIQQQPHVTDQN